MLPDWKDDLERCFDQIDRLFASYTMDENRAFHLLMRLRAEGVGWYALSNAIRDILATDGCSAQHIELQIAQVEQRFRPWMPD